MSGDVIYLDSSALAKLVVHERGSHALKLYLRSRRRRVSCALARAELVRAVRPHGGQAVIAARRVLGSIDMISVDDALLDAAAELGDHTLRTLDAIHLAAARTIGRDLAALITYDARQGAAAIALHIPVEAPGS